MPIARPVYLCNGHLGVCSGRRVAVRTQILHRRGGIVPSRKGVSLLLVSPSGGGTLRAVGGTRWVHLLSTLDDLRKIPIHFAGMSQMARDASAIVVMCGPMKRDRAWRGTGV
jgi:hypothetical protein